jgi:ribosomal-protein-alanine N-acetyltransferase
MNVVIETDRLLLRTFTEDDAALLFELNVDPEVTRYTHDGMSDLSQAKKVLDEVILPQYALYHHGRWAVLQKSNLQFTGWCGLKCVPERQEIDLGYRFKKIFWGKGFATEAAFASLQYGFYHLGFQKIVGRALPENLASIRVLEKCGLHYVGEEYVHGYLHKTYQATNPVIQL